VWHAAGQRLTIIASTWRFSASTSIKTVVAPRVWALAVTSRTSAEPTPSPCRASATTTPISTIWAPATGPAVSIAMACPMIVPFSVATIASALSRLPVRIPSMAPLTGAPPVKNRR